MESLLTPLVGRLLSRFVKSAAGNDGSDLRTSLQGGNVSLHNLELNLDSFLHKLPVAVERAFAKQLTVSIPWTRLNSQPIEVVPLSHHSWSMPDTVGVYATLYACEFASSPLT